MQRTRLLAPRAALRAAVIGVGLLVLGLTSAPAAGQSTQDIVDEVDEDTPIRVVPVALGGQHHPAL